MAFTKENAKSYMVGVVLLIVTLIFVVRLMPWAWKYINESPDGVNYTITDVPGVGLLTGFIVFILMLVIGISIVVKVFDLI